MSDQVQHLRTRLSIEVLKDLLFKEEERKVILNTELGIWAVVNIKSGKELANSVPTLRGANSVRGVIVITLLYGVKTEYYDDYGKKDTRKYYNSAIVKETEKFRKTFETYFKLIKKEEMAKKFVKLAEVLGDEKARNLLKTHKLVFLQNDYFTKNIYFDTCHCTTLDERLQLQDLGINVSIMEYV